MALSVGSSSFTSTPVQPWIPVAKPSGTGSTANELLVCWHWLDNDGSLFNMSAPSGWNMFSSDGGVRNGFVKSWYKWVTPFEPSSYTFGGATGADGLAGIVRIIGITDPNRVSMDGWIIPGPSVTTLSHPSPPLWTSDNDSMYVGFWGGVVFTACTWTLPGGFTNAGMPLTQSAYMQGIIATRAGGAGSLGPYTATSSAWNGFTPPFGDLVGGILISQSAAGTSGAILTTTAGMTASGVVTGGAGILPSATYQHLIDWAGNGSYTDTGDDVSKRVNALSTYTIRYGRDQARALSPMKPGSLSGLQLDNNSRDYSPENASSPLAGKLTPARPNRIVVTFQSQTYILWQGHTDDFDLDPSPGNRWATITGLDALADLSGAVNTELFEGIRSGDAINYVLDAIGWSSGLRDIDPGVSIFPHWWEDGADAWTAIAKIINSEGPPSFVTIDSATGAFVFRDRTHRIRLAASTTVQATFRDAGTDPRFSWPLGYSAGWKDVINSVSFSVEQRGAIDPAVVWETDNAFTFAPNEVKSVIAHADAPFKNAIIPQPVIDYYLNTGSIDVSLSRTSGGSTQILMQESSGVSTAMITGLRLRANSVPVRNTLTITSSDSASIGAYGARTYPEDAPWAAPGDAQAVADLVVAARAQRLPTVSVRLTGGNAAILTQQLARDLSDRVHVTDAETGLNADFFIEQIEHQIHGAGNKIHHTTFGCEKAQTPLDSPSTVFIFGSSTNGRFGTNVFGH